VVKANQKALLAAAAAEREAMQQKLGQRDQQARRLYKRYGDVLRS